MAPRITAVENIYQHQPTSNGASPFWCFGNTTLVAAPDGRLYITSYEKTDEAIPYQNVKWALWQRSSDGWTKIYQDPSRTREPSPMAILPKQNIALISTNPTLTAPDVQDGPANPAAVTFRIDVPNPGETLKSESYVWPPGHYFCEHSYRSFVADPAAGEVAELHQVDQGDMVWSFRDASGQWGHPGRLTWPWGANYPIPQAIRVCYPNVLLHNRAFFHCGVSDIIEPNPLWREAKFKITGQKWDYEFRRLFFTWTPDITSAPFEPWVEVASRDATCGWILPCDMALNPAAKNSVTVMWVQRALDERLRAEFYPNEKQHFSLNIARITQGRVEFTRELSRLDEHQAGHTGRFGRFHQTPDGRLFVVAAIGDPRAALAAPGPENHCSLRLMELTPDGQIKSTHDLGHTFATSVFFVATTRAGNAPSNTLHILGENAERWLQYVQVQLEG